jgi:hypothetical protein
MVQFWGPGAAPAANGQRTGLARQMAAHVFDPAQLGDAIIDVPFVAQLIGGLSGAPAGLAAESGRDIRLGLVHAGSEPLRPQHRTRGPPKGIILWCSTG